jgi:hypothetical protein
MFLPPSHRHHPRSPLDRRRDAALRAELTHVSTMVLELQKDHQIQFARTAQLQREIDEIKATLKKLLERTDRT